MSSVTEALWREGDEHNPIADQRQRDELKLVQATSANTAALAHRITQLGPLSSSQMRPARLSPFDDPTLAYRQTPPN